MGNWTPLLLGIAISLSLSAAIAIALAKPLRALLGEVCDTERQGNFWQTFTNVMLFLTPLLSTVLFGSLGDSPVSPMILLRNLLASSLGGAFVTMLGMGLVIMRYTSTARPSNANTRKSHSDEFWSDAKD